MALLTAQQCHPGAAQPSNLSATESAGSEGAGSAPVMSIRPEWLTKQLEASRTAHLTDTQRGSFFGGLRGLISLSFDIERDRLLARIAEVHRAGAELTQGWAGLANVEELKTALITAQVRDFLRLRCRCRPDECGFTLAPPGISVDPDAT